MASIKNTKEAFEKIINYSGGNPYLLMLKRDIVVHNKSNVLSDFSIEYILKNYDRKPRIIQKIVKIADWYGEKKKTDWNLDFVPSKLKVISYMGETTTCYHCYVQYRQSVDPVQAFLPKTAVLTNFLVEDYHNVEVNFDRYDKLAEVNRAILKPDKPPHLLKAHQKEAVQFLLSRKKCVLADDMGLGKMEPVSSLIPTPSGYRKMGEIEVGDQIFGRDGRIHNVLEIFPHKDKEIYKVTFSDGTSAECGLEHLWVVRTKNDVKRNRGWKVKSLKELIESGFQYNDASRISKGLNGRNKYEIPVTEPVEYEKKEYLINPYVLGMCIGDGNLCSGGIVISIPDSEKEDAERVETLITPKMILKEDRHSNCPRYRIIEKERGSKNPYIQEIKRLGLNVNGNYKFIPEEYKMGSINQRIELIRGLMDSDGSIRDGNKIGFYTSSERLADDFAEVIFSLGGIARKHCHSRTRKGETKKEYCVSIQVKFNPFHLTRKAEAYHPTFLKYCSKYIVSAEYVRNEDAKCLMVDSEDHTYLTGKSYIVTHNTTSMAVASIEGNFDNILIICPASLKTQWKEELEWYVPGREISIVESFQGLTKPELEQKLGYGPGRSGKKRDELLEEMRDKGKWAENRYVIINFDILAEFYKIPETRSKENIGKAYENSPMLQLLYGKKSLIIIDEAHNLSNTKSQTFQTIKDLIKRGSPDSLYLSTGTPITNSPINYFNFLSLIGDPITLDYRNYMIRYCGGKEFPKTEEDKARRNEISAQFVKDKGKYSWYDLTDEEKKALNDLVIRSGVKMKLVTDKKVGTNLDELRERTAHLYLRRVKEDLKDITTEKRIHEVYYDLDAVQLMEYERLWEEYEDAQLEADPTKEINKELIEGGIYRRYCSNIMVPNTIKLAQPFIDRGKKVIIACCYDEELNTLREHYGDSCVVYNGKMDSKHKDAAKMAFITNPEKKVFIGNIDAAGTGLNLVCSNVLIFNNFDWVPGNNRQMEDRIYRLGQTKDVDIYYQIFNNTQYEKMWKTIIRKETIINAVIKKEEEK